MAYRLLRFIVRTGLILFYKKRVVIGKENIPKEGAVIFAGNHQNAVLDAFNIVCFNTREVYFATMAGAFKKKWITKFLLYLKLYPVFRPRDGRETMANNKASFEFFVNKLLDNQAVGVFIEGQGSQGYYLQSPKKGLARLAFQVYEERPNHQLYVVPVSYYTENTPQFYQNMVMQYGKAISVKEYIESYKDQKAKFLRELTLDTDTAIRKAMLDIPNDDAYAGTLASLQKSTTHLKNPLMRLQQMKALLAKDTLPYPSASPSQKSFLLFDYLIYILLWLPNIVLNFLPYYLANRLRDKIVNDIQFAGTMLFAMLLLVFPFWYLILTILGLIFWTWWALLLPIIAYIVGTIWLSAKRRIFNS